LGESGFEIVYDVGGDDSEGGEVGAFFEGFVFQPEDVEVSAGRAPALRREALRL
jgi:hypothetical protein